MEDFVKKMPNWLRYVLAIPISLVFSFAVSMFILFSNRYFTGTDSLFYNIISFIVGNGLNAFLFFYCMDIVLPKYQFEINLSLSLIFGLFLTFGMGFLSSAGSDTDSSWISYLLMLLSVSVSVYQSYKLKQKNKEEKEYLEEDEDNY